MIKRLIHRLREGYRSRRSVRWGVDLMAVLAFAVLAAAMHASMSIKTVLSLAAFRRALFQ